MRHNRTRYVVSRSSAKTYGKVVGEAKRLRPYSKRPLQSVDIITRAPAVALAEWRRRLPAENASSRIARRQNGFPEAFSRENSSRHRRWWADGADLRTAR